MIRRQELYDRQCVASLIHVVEQAPLRAAVRRPLAIHRSSVGLLLLWSLLRWERTFLICTLERLGVDLWSLTRDVDEALKLCSKEARDVGARSSSADLDPLLRGWLDQAAAQARALGHDFLGGEHLLLALLADADSDLAAVFQRNGLTYDSLKQAVGDALRGPASSQVGGTEGGLKSTLQADALSGAAPSPVLVPDDAQSGHAGQAASPPRPQTGHALRYHAERGNEGEGEASTWIAEIDRPAVGVPRRFGVFIMMLIVTLYAVLFSLLKLLRANNLVFGLLALLFTGIGIGQAVLFGGRYPRSASIWMGSILVPIEVCVFALCQKDLLYVGSSGTMVVVSLLAVFLFSMPLGAVVGYLFGTLTAGGFFLVDRYEKRQQAAKESSAE